jgi:hypothetical protein
MTLTLKIPDLEEELILSISDQIMKILSDNKISINDIYPDLEKAKVKTKAEFNQNSRSLESLVPTNAEWIAAIATCIILEGTKHLVNVLDLESMKSEKSRYKEKINNIFRDSISKKSVGPLSPKENEFIENVSDDILEGIFNVP